ncbi:MAG TPA: hypothetical protein VE326_11115 [Candidatus Binatia bacterium]|nr:hypothetical protein [Candidatus Binatia bacterium]
MSHAERTPADVIAEAIASTAATVDNKGAYCSGWVLVASWMDSDGDYWLTRLSDDRQPRWQTIGMLRTAQIYFEHEMNQAADEDD